MRIYSSLFLLGALGVLSGPGAAAPPVDTSSWTCESCPYPKGTTGSVEVGVGAVSDDSAKFGDFTGLESKGAYLLLGGNVSHRGEDGYFADLTAADLGIDTRTLDARAGRAGAFGLQLRYSEIPRHFADDAATPFLGNGGNVLSLPPGYPAATTGAMPLATTLQPVELGYKRSRLDLGGSWVAGENWSYRVNLRQDKRDGTRSTYGSFFSTASQLAAPVDEVTDQFEVSANYADRRLQATLAYQYSQFSNNNTSLTWANPFQDVNGGDRGQLALAPDNEYHQIMGTASYAITPTIRASADLAVGRGTQNAGYLAPTLNPGLAATVPTLPAQSLNGQVDTFNGGVKVSAAPLEGLRLNASYDRNVRDNGADRLSYPRVVTDMFLRADTRTNTPFDFTQDLFRLTGDYRASDEIKLTGGAEYDRMDRNFQEVVTSHETTLWGRMGIQATDDVALSLKLALADRDHSTYGVSTWFGYSENPLLRRYNLAARQRQSAELRADIVLGEGVNLGLDADVAIDDYNESLVGLTYGRSSGVGLDLSAAITEAVHVQAYWRGDWMYSRQAGSAAAAQPDWWAYNNDDTTMFGLGLRWAAIEDKLDLGADVVYTRMRSNIDMDASAVMSAFPTARTSVDSYKLFGTYRLRENVSITASVWYERYRATDWRLDGVMPATVPSLLSYGVQPPDYDVSVVQLALRYGF